MLTPELEKMFTDIENAILDYAGMYPKPSLKDLESYRERVKPPDTGERKMFALWTLDQLTSGSEREPECANNE